MVGLIAFEPRMTQRVYESIAFSIIYSFFTDLKRLFFICHFFDTSMVSEKLTFNFRRRND